MIKNYALCALPLLGIGLSNPDAEAATQYHRVVWDKNPANQAVVGFSPVGTSVNPTVKYGTTTNESSWTTVAATNSKSFAGSLTSYFVRLTNLPANSPIYYTVCDQDGCGQKMWFKTAPVDQSPYVVVAGGDTRTGWTNRRNGNQLVAKIRPLFVMHGGDFTNKNSAYEMGEFLKDWQLSFSSDVIDSVNYKRVYPLLPTHGNHEDNDYSTLCKVFGMDPNGDGQCNPKDSYAAFNVSPLLRVYTLNSQFKDSGWSAYATTMNSWLANDLAASGSSAKWRFAQYHKPIFPHYTGKSENTILHSWWAQHFYNHAVNLVVESDTHINKMTYSVKPSGSNFVKTTDGGTVFVGEGSWGAPARSANDPKSWTIDLASIQQFKVIQVESDAVRVRTAQFNNSADALTRAQRSSDPLLLPNGVNWWQAAEVGEVLTLKRNTQNRTVIDSGTVTPPPPVEEPEVLTNGTAKTGVSGTKAGWKHFYIDVPAGVNSLNVSTSGGSGDADLYVRVGQQPSNTAYDCRPYKNGNAESCVVNLSTAARVYVSLYAYASYSGVQVLASYQGSTPPPPVTGGTLTETNLSGNQGQWQYFELNIPAGMSSLKVTVSGGNGDVDLYLQKGSQPSTSSYICRPYQWGNNESCDQANPDVGNWYIGLRGYEAYSGVKLEAIWK